MAIFFFLLGLLQCFLLWRLGNVGHNLQLLAQEELQRNQFQPPQSWPPCALIVPVAGNHPSTASALLSLAEQDYPDFNIFFVTETIDDSAAPIIASLERAYDNIHHVVAGRAAGCSQKNHNTLTAIAAAGDAAILAFCDSTHIAKTNFLRCLVAPLARQECAFTTGYHEVEPQDNEIVTLAYTLSVMFMRFMQGIPGLAQPWGGAMAMTAKAFRQYNVQRLWATNVVDDCSLAALLARKHIHVRLCPAAILKTTASNHNLSVWRAWLDRQILFLKFCMPGQWLGLGLVCALMILPLSWCIISCADGILNIGTATAPFLALCWLCAVIWVIGAWRAYIPRPIPIPNWLLAFLSACLMFALAYFSTLNKHSILWNHAIYSVDKGGKVKNTRIR